MMKNIIFITSLAISMAFLSNGQQIPTVGSSTAYSNDFWTRAGNFHEDGGNLFGTRYNSPSYFITGGGNFSFKVMNGLTNQNSVPERFCKIFAKQYD